MQKGFSVPLLLVALLIISGMILGFYYFSKDTVDQTKLPTSKLFNQTEPKKVLKTYTNENLGFELQYPDNLEIKEDSEEEFNKRGNGNFRKNFTGYVTYPPANILGAVVILDESNSYEDNPLTVWVFENPKNLSIDKWYEKYWYYPFVWGDYTQRRNSVAPTNEATISGQIAKSGIVSYQPGYPGFIYLKNASKMYLFKIIDNPQKSGEKILENFKFTN